MQAKGFIALLGILSVAGCGFRPLYTGSATKNAVSGQQAEERVASVFIDEIPDRIGQILHRSLSDGLTPLGEPENPRYRLSIEVPKISTSEQAVRKDNLATRYSMEMTAKYTLYSYPENKKLMSGSSLGSSNYDVQRSPYATDMAEEKTKERLAKIIGKDIALRVGAFLKGYKDTRKEKTDIAETPVKKTVVVENVRTDMENKDIQIEVEGGIDTTEETEKNEIED